MEEESNESCVKIAGKENKRKGNRWHGVIIVPN